MEWWGWVMIVAAALAALVAFFEWRSWNKPLSRGLEDTPSFWGGTTPQSGNDWNKPHD